MCFQAADTGQRWSHVSHFDLRKKPPCVQFSSFAKETLTISYLILFLPKPWSVCAARRRVSSSAPRCKQRMRGKVGPAWLWRVPLCLAVTYWLVGLSVIWPARRQQQQQLCRPSPRLRRRSQRRPTCCKHLLGSLPLFPFLPPSLLSSLATSSPESVTAFSFIYIYTTPHPTPHPTHPPLARLASSVSPLLPSLSPNHGDGGTALPKNSLRCWFTSHALMCHLCVFRSVRGRLTLLGWMLSPANVVHSRSFVLCFYILQSLKCRSWSFF